MGRSDYYADGQYNVYCDLCGRKAKSSEVEKTWDNHYVCRHHKEVRNPQDFIRGIRDNQTVPFVRAQPAYTFVGPTCTPPTSSSIPGYAGPGCSVPAKPYLF